MSQVLGTFFISRRPWSQVRALSSPLLTASLCGTDLAVTAAAALGSLVVLQVLYGKQTFCRELGSKSQDFTKCTPSYSVV